MGYTNHLTRSSIAIWAPAENCCHTWARCCRWSSYEALFFRPVAITITSVSECRNGYDRETVTTHIMAKWECIDIMQHHCAVSINVLVRLECSCCTSSAQPLYPCCGPPAGTRPGLPWIMNLEEPFAEYASGEFDRWHLESPLVDSSHGNDVIDLIKRDFKARIAFHSNP